MRQGVRDEEEDGRGSQRPLFIHKLLISHQTSLSPFHKYCKTDLQDFFETLQKRTKSILGSVLETQVAVTQKRQQPESICSLHRVK